MKVTEFKPATKDNFKKFGSIVSLADRQRDGGMDRFDWYADIVNNSFESLFIGAVDIRKSCDNSITVLERHKNLKKIIILMGDDAVFNLSAGDTKEEVCNNLESFQVTKNSVIILNEGIWHFAPNVMNDRALMLVLVEKKTYTEDCEVMELEDCGLSVGL